MDRHTCIHTYMYGHKSTHTNAHVCINIHPCYTCADTNTHAYAQTNTYICFGNLQIKTLIYSLFLYIWLILKNILINGPYKEIGILIYYF